MNDEIMNNEVIESDEEIVETEKNNGTKTLIGVGLAGLVLGGLACKFAKPIAKKVKSKFGRKNEIVETDDAEVEYEFEVDDN